jgi:probable HAF family extracellular repeat protein
MRLIGSFLLLVAGLSPVLSAWPVRKTAAALGSGPPRYTVVALPLSEAHAINDRGQVAGDSQERATLWQNGRAQDLGVLPFPGQPDEAFPPKSSAIALNNQGQVVGNAGRFIVYPEGGGFDSLPFLWTGGKMRSLRTLGGLYGEAAAINESGAVVGQADRYLPHEIKQEFSYARTRAFLWQKGRMRNLGTLGGPGSDARGINDRGQVVGTSLLRPRANGRPDDYPSHAFLWEKGRMRDLGCPTGYLHSDATAINNRGQVVGEVSGQEETPSRAFLWQQGRMEFLGADRGRSSHVLAINERSQIVGFTEKVPYGNRRAVLWEHSRLHDLNTLLPSSSGWVLNEARDINHQGQIVGVGTWKGKQRGFLLTPRAGSGHDGDTLAQHNSPTRA